MFETIEDFFSKLFTQEGYQHAFCILYDPNTLAMKVIGDGVTAIAYFLIPIMIFYLIKKRPDIPFNWAFWLFIIFILACGTTHVFDIVTLWYPYYRLDAAVRLITAIASIGTAGALINLFPRIVKIPLTPYLAALEKELVDTQVKLAKAEEKLQAQNGKA